MPLSSQDAERVRQHVREHGACPYCGNNHWELHDEVVAFPTVDLEYKRIMDGALYAAVALCCSDCGNVRLVAAKTLGLF